MKPVKQKQDRKSPATQKAAGPLPVQKAPEAAPAKSAPYVPLWGWQ